MLSMIRMTTYLRLHETIAHDTSLQQDPDIAFGCELCGLEVIMKVFKFKFQIQKDLLKVPICLDRNKGTITAKVFIIVHKPKFGWLCFWLKDLLRSC